MIVLRAGREPSCVAMLDWMIPDDLLRSAGRQAKKPPPAVVGPERAGPNQFMLTHSLSFSLSRAKDRMVAKLYPT
jgi:hypothetical protein